MARLTTFTRNATSVAQGAPVVVGPEGDSFTITTRGFTDAYVDRLWALRRTATIRYNTGLSANETPVSPDALPPSIEDGCVAQAMAEKCLIGVDGLDGDDGAPVTIEQFCELIQHRENRPLLALAMQAAGSVGRATKALLESAEKN
ncbi:hypothetical protein [Acetobacter sp. DsW_063]|uniref:hypothetical protein n=1 Tax=Acetobacter sp. DsW_063 TaxID=1514894 RepID=UPI000A38FE5E|nr:hypothetical protein [Acetobacter sp. DsW_063]OUJ10852.1 hypothetical protein HK28_05005 [Acetobacter sp. DsW_063]